MIKGGLFGKLLKQFFIISLISCFILLGNSFANAGKIGYIGESETSIYSPDYTILVNGRGNLLTQYYGLGKRLLQFNKGNYFFRSTNSKPYMYVSSVVNGELKNPFQGYVQSYFLCDFIGLNSGSAYPSNCTKYPIDNGDYNSVIRIIGSLNNDGYFYYNSYGCSNSYGKYQQSLDVCFSSSQFNRSVCFYGGTPQTFDAGYNCNGSNGLGGNFYTHQGSQNIYASNLAGSLGLSAYFDNIDSSYLGGSPSLDGNSGIAFIPSTGSRLEGRLSTSQGYTNSQMVNAYQCIGLIPEMCYGGFPIDDIFDPSESFEDFSGYVAGQGATIFDLYNLYSSSFSNIDQFLSTVLTRYENGQINSFKTEPKALLMLGSQLKVAGFKVSYISTYCNLLLNENNNNFYSGTSADDLRAQSCLRSQQINNSLKTSDGLDINFQSSNRGIFSGDDVNFDPDTFFSNMFDRFESGLKDVSGNSVGVIPGYIVLFTLAFILLRMLSH